MMRLKTCCADGGFILAVPHRNALMALCRPRCCFSVLQDEPEKQGEIICSTCRPWGQRFKKAWKFMNIWEEKKMFHLWKKIPLGGFNGLFPLLFFSFSFIRLVSTWTPDLDVFKVCLWAFSFCAKQTSREALWAHISMKTTNACWWLYLRGGC